MGQAFEWRWIKERLERLDDNQQAAVLRLIESLEHSGESGVGGAEIAAQGEAAEKVWESDPVSYDDV